MKGRKIQKEAKQPGFKDAMKVQGLRTNQSVTEDMNLALHLGTGEKPKTNKETLPDRFQVQTSKYFTRSLWKLGTREGIKA